jgi:hypothetical protein
MLFILKVINRLIVMMLMRLILKHLNPFVTLTQIFTIYVTYKGFSYNNLLPRKVIIHLQSHVKFQYPVVKE